MLCAPRPIVGLLDTEGAGPDRGPQGLRRDESPRCQ